MFVNFMTGLHQHLKRLAWSEHLFASYNCCHTRIWSCSKESWRRSEGYLNDYVLKSFLIQLTNFKQILLLQLRLNIHLFDLQKLREQETMGHVLLLKKRALNDRLMLAERGFLDTEGIQGSRWFRHIVSILRLLLKGLSLKATPSIIFRQPSV